MELAQLSVTDDVTPHCRSAQLLNRLGQLVSKSFYPKKFVSFFARMASKFAWICEYLQASCSPHFLSDAV